MPSDLDRFAEPVASITDALAPRDSKGRKLVPARAEGPGIEGDGLLPEGSATTGTER